MSKQDSLVQAEAAEDELDDWDQRIFSTGCSEEQLRMNDCYYEKKDWRACKAEICWSSASRRRCLVAEQQADEVYQMEAFRQCWKRKGNEERTQSKDVPSSEK
ncbi:uncharacterized protein PV07_04292 [Cladophialophora immunda]|uniref:Uncharacterized protein n=1 Tax=Cladophialophora immunda TaxID=569365 RepID=A0A0D2DAN3_9EURO|nr:uncharacterized protein PV07_04292 [Cladophialophora immunda]KIW32769.1 hypothetical protein PV07_04292 [Cladophialophora immunda]